MRHHIFQHISTENYNYLLTRQNGVCAICGKKNDNNKKLSVDHNHVTDEVRGLLCFHCNSSLGNFEDDKVRLENAIVYLDVHTGIYLSERPIRNQFGAEIVKKIVNYISGEQLTSNGKSDWGLLSDEDKAKIETMSTREIRQEFGIGKSTAFAWKAKSNT